MNGAKFSRLKHSATTLGLVAAAFAANPAYADTETTQGEAVIIQPLSFTAFEDLHFGKIVPSNQAGTVTVGTNDGRTANNGIILVGSDQQAARFTGQGTFFQIVSIALGSNTIQITGPGAPMTVHTFTIGSTPSVVLTTNPRRFRIVNGLGLFAFTVGATLDVGANQAAGQYSGTWDLTLEYQ